MSSSLTVGFIGEEGQGGGNISPLHASNPGKQEEFHENLKYVNAVR